MLVFRPIKITPSTQKIIYGGIGDVRMQKGAILKISVEGRRGRV